ncbi:hypothetical protein PRIPAC_94499, partial [Pristionchus pacificus]|uniref:Uncharacterized protein n=1 Tax=Pristionchus pacificus TaxID=54126 RepID=A0A2A6C998_PRIPA
SRLIILPSPVTIPLSAPSPPATSTLIEELLANGGKRQFKSFNGLYLTDDFPDKHLYALDKRNWSPPQEWTIEKINNDEVAIKSNRGFYIGHGRFGWAIKAQSVQEWEMLTPVKNSDGSWSFKSRWNYWLSAHTKGKLTDDEKHRYNVSFERENKKSEHWQLELVQS